MINFKINVKGLLAGIAPAVPVSTGGTIKDCPSASLLCLEATPECLYIIANNGRVSVRNPVDYLGSFCTEYEFKSGGTITIRTADLISAINSFGKEEVLTVVAQEANKAPLEEGASEEEKTAWEALAGVEVQMRPVSDPEVVQTLPVLLTKVELQVPKETPTSEITLSRPSFCRAVERVLFAGGFEERREKFLYWVLRAEKNKARYVAGSGTRFAVTNVKGEGLSGASAPTSLLVPVAESATVLKVFKDFASPSITIRHYGSKIAFEAGNLRMVMVGLNPNVQWVDENKILNRKNLYKFTLPLSEFEMATKGIEATNSDEAKKRDPVHAVTMLFDTDKKVLSLTTNRGTKKAVRKIKVLDTWTSDTHQPREVSFKCVVGFLSEVTKYADKSQFVQVELIGKDSPMIVRLYSPDKVSHIPLINLNAAINGEEDFTMLIGNLSEAR